MDKRFDKISSWLFFELLLTVGGFGLFLYNYEIYRSEYGNATFYLILCIFIARTIFLGRAWASLGGEPTVSTGDEPEVPDDSTPIDPLAE